ncbi:hypothetical protein [Acetobacter oeni]|uniref:hypothetical protein n=1 Tax=Acetobacter oeni TaxID=304077 RepID=UPI0015683E3F|nr:hypothetical protein [Acetobacter oeni]
MSFFNDIASYVPHLNIVETGLLAVVAGITVFLGHLSARRAAPRYVPVRIRQR